MDQLTLLSTGEVGLVAQVMDSSNATFVADVTAGDAYSWAIYKPQAGERPLWDFEPGVHARERAAHVLSEWLGWGLVPTTVVREDAPMGVGSLQWFVDGDQRQHYFTIARDRPDLHDQLRRLAVFDVVTNNTDRKSGHVLLDAAGRVWGIDHGLCFAAEPKLRTVIWDFAGEPLPEDTLEGLDRLTRDGPDELAELLSASELVALRGRARRLVAHGVLPFDQTGHGYPWPLV